MLASACRPIADSHESSAPTCGDTRYVTRQESEFTDLAARYRPGGSQPVTETLSALADVAGRPSAR
jgi:hypothetical protein